MGQILILEEDGASFQQIKQFVEGKGHLVWHFTNTSEALAFLKQYEVGLIISAVNLGDSDVLNFLRTVKANSSMQKIPFVFYCVEPERYEKYATDASIRSARILGARKFILMPEFSANAVWEQLEDCLAETSQKRDTLGSQVKTYSLSDLS